MLALAAAAVVGWVLLATGGAEARFPALLARLRHLDRHANVVVRLCLAMTLAMAALGLHPRHGTDLWQEATLGFPDLELRMLRPGWGVLAAVELALAVILLSGRWPRASGAAVVALTALGLWLFGIAMLAYAGALAGAGTYLALHESQQAESVAHQRASFSLRVLTGTAFLWCGLYYKVLQPNLVLMIITKARVPTFGLGHDAFVLGMALVEVAAGALMMAGVLVRPLAAALFGPFLFLSVMLGESPLGHLLFYGNLIALITGGAGSWPTRRQVSAASRMLRRLSPGGRDQSVPVNS